MKGKIYTFFKILFYLILITSIVYGVYKIFNWKRIFDKEYEAKQLALKPIILPPVIGDREINYADKKWLADLIAKLKTKNIDILTIDLTVEGEVSLVTNLKYSIKVNPSKNLDLAWNNLTSTLDSNEIQPLINKNN
jgi:hypothetical protein